MDRKFKRPAFPIQRPPVERAETLTKRKALAAFSRDVKFLVRPPNKRSVPPSLFEQMKGNKKQRTV